MIDPDKIYSYFDDNHGPLTRSSNGWYDGTCPFCRSHKLAVNPDKFAVKCWKGCFRGGVVSFVKEYLGCTYYDAHIIIDDMVPRLNISDYITQKSVIRRDIELPEGYERILDGTTPSAKRARNYLMSRRFDMNYLDMIGVGYCGYGDYSGYIIIPFKRDGDIVYFIGRDFMDRGDKWRYKNPSYEEFGIGKGDVLFNEEALYTHKKVYMMEGWADAATIGDNAISIQGKSLGPMQLSIIQKSPVEEVIVVADRGAEKEGLEMLEKLYKMKKTKLIKLDGLDGKDVNEIGASTVLARESKAASITDLYSFNNEARSINTRKKKLLI